MADTGPSGAIREFDGTTYRTRDTVADVPIENETPGGVEGDYTIHHPSGEVTPVFGAAERHREDDPAVESPVTVRLDTPPRCGTSRTTASSSTSCGGS